eukprot:s109_g23.t1
MSVGLLLDLLVVCPFVTYALRAQDAVLDILEVQGDDRCVFTARPSNSTKFDVNSLSFKDPDFTFFDSREFFLSSGPSCLEKLDNVELRSVPNTTAGRQMQQERRFKVKQLKEGMNVLNKKDASTAQKLFQQMRSTSTAELPAVELHMFPDEPSNVDSEWHVLLVPKARELFQTPVYLCQPTKASESSAGTDEEVWPRCVSRLKFEALPLRLMNAVKDWDPALDTTRSVPHNWIFGLELLLLFSALLMLCKTALPVFKLIHLSLQEDKGEEDADAMEVQKLLEQPLPKSYHLSQHLEVCENVEGDSLVPDVILEASDEVQVMEMKATEGNKSGGKLRRLMNRVMGCMSSKKPQAVWGRVQKPQPGWILLYDSARGHQKAVIDNSSEPVYRANVQLMIPLTALLRRQLVLATSHTSVQYFMLERLASHLPVPSFITVAVTFFVLHVFVLCQAEWTARWGHRCDEVLEHQMRLEPPKCHAIRNFLIILAILILSVLVGLILIWTSPGSTDSGWSFLSPCLGLMGAIALHAWDLRSSVTGISKWREPQISAEYTEFMGKKLPKSTELMPLNKTRERACLIIDFSTWLMAAAGLTCLIFMGLDAFSMQGAMEVIRQQLDNWRTGKSGHREDIHRTSILSFVIPFVPAELL